MFVPYTSRCADHSAAASGFCQCLSKTFTTTAAASLGVIGNNVPTYARALANVNVPAKRCQDRRVVDDDRRAFIREGARHNNVISVGHHHGGGADDAGNDILLDGLQLV